LFVLSLQPVSEAKGEAGETLGCAETLAASSARINQERERFKAREDLPRLEMARDAWRECLGAINEYRLILGPLLPPLPDFGEVSEGLCASLRSSAFEAVDQNLSPASRPAILNRVRSLSEAASEIREALR
jgi:hypothetical protein